MAESLGSILEFTENLKDAEAPPALPDNDYPGEIAAAENGIGASGNPRIDVTFVIKPEDFPADFDGESYPDGKQVHYYLPSTDNAKNRFRIRKFCEAIGARLGAKIDVNDWIGKSASLTSVAEEFEGSWNERVRKVAAL